MVEDCLVFDLYRLLKGTRIQPGLRVTGQLGWRSAIAGEQVTSVDYQVHFGTEHGQLWLDHAAQNRSNGDRRGSDYSIEMIAMQQPFGGHRWWFVCPLSGAHVSKLYLPPGGHTFASHKAHGLAYKSQRRSPCDQAIARAFALRERLGDQGAIGNPLDKPPGMRRITFKRKLAALNTVEARVSAFGLALLCR